MGYSPRYHMTTSEWPNQHSETDDWQVIAREISRCQDRGDYTGFVIDTHTGKRTDFDSKGILAGARIKELEGGK
jgi:hypothetical protein